MAAPLYSTESGRLYHAGQILISCVGLPARGKTHIARSILRYLQWLGVKTEVFSLGDYRRKRLGDPSNLPKDYFSPYIRSAESEKLRTQMKTEMMEIVMNYFHKDGGQVAIYDANNTTIAERQYLRDVCAREGINIMFIETICTDAIVEKNIRAVKLSSPDYKGWDPEDALKDYWARIRNQEKFYEPIENPSFPYVKIIDIGSRIIVNNIQGYLQSRIVFFLMNIHNRYRKIYMARSGASYAEHSYKADAGLSEIGESYATALRDFVLNKRQQDRMDPQERQRQRRLVIWTSARRRCAGTAKPFLEFGYKVIERGQMAEINPGIVDGLSRREIKQLYPDEYDRSVKEPYAHRFPRAESYHDLSVRLEPTIFELERDRSDLLIIGHGSVLRCLFSYLKGLAPVDIPKVMIERGDLIEISPSSYGVMSKTYTFWRAPAGHEDVQTEPGTIPGTYGSPANPPANFGNLLKSPAGFGEQYGRDFESRTPSAGRDWLSLTDSTPRMQNLSLEEMQSASLKSPQRGNAPHLPHVAEEEARVGSRENDDPYEDRDGESGNSCAWQNAKSPTLADVQQQAPGRWHEAAADTTAWQS